MSQIFLDALLDTFKMIPFLFIIYMAIEYLEFKLGDNLIKKVKKAGKVAPAAGALFGLVPQCGFSVMATALYAKRVVTVGTLLAVYLATSDEALPIIMSKPDKAGLIVPLLAAKLVIALSAGYLTDFIIIRRKHDPAEVEICASVEGIIIEVSEETETIDEKGCCGHSCPVLKIDFRELIIHPLRHTMKVFVYLFIASLLINYAVFRVGDANLGRVFLQGSILQPVIAAIIGLIPNCAASIAITDIFLKGGLSFGSTIAGLCSGAGLGLLVLFKENKSLRDSFKVTGLLAAVSAAAGILIQVLIG
ncbi:MAG: putative manganese transporter [Bacillota bacterium]|nr:putative manganese transporter [Bacillota bacterium]